jgi:hypothetical protein
MRERNCGRNEDALYVWYDRIRASARAQRIDWMSNRVRFFIGERDAGNQVDFKKIRTNHDIERSLQAVESSINDYSYHVDPVSRERHYSRAPESAPKLAHFEADFYPRIEAGIPSVIYLEQRDFAPPAIELKSEEYLERIHEIKNGDEEERIEMAQQVVKEIRSVCGCGKKHDHQASHTIQVEAPADIWG